MSLSGKRILVTGADGFIGSHLVDTLVKEGAAVKALSLYNSLNSWGWLEDVECLGDIEVVTGDIRDSQLMRTITYDIDIIFHLAALIGIPYSYDAPQSYVQTNVSGTLNILQAALDNDVQRLIHTSTSEVYGTAQYVPIDEKHPLQPQSPYSATKIAADAMAASFHHSFNLPLVIARPFNTYGPRQSARAVIPTIITQILSGNNPINVGSLRPTRDFNYVEDTCSGLIALAECQGAIGETINIGSNHEISIGALLDTITNLMQAEIEVRTDEDRIRPPASEVERLWCDNSKIHELTNFTPKTGLREGLRRTIDWFRQERNLSKYKTDIYNV